MLAVAMTTMMMAENLTPEQALQQAQSFIQKRIADGKNPRRAPGTKAPQLKMTRQVSGLYLFNMTDGGFVIVSNDDCATPILGYSDNGRIDPDNMPDNMRAWLQGYAKEIAWMQQHPTEVAAARGQEAQTVSPVKTPISPLVSTTWDQGEPYNNLCPEYASGKPSATGCVATAMAQLMYYTERKAGNSTTTTTKEIPGYTTGSYGFNIPAIPAGSTINWSDMIPDYSSSYTEAQATAVATLMKYCGGSLKMDYGPSSNTAASIMVDALKNYFDYAETTTFVDRSSYSYSNWIDILYHELSEGRPMGFCGQADDGSGHAFVCDGYQGEDYFHINWGWGGMSDAYFKISALNPYAQGTGGSSSQSGYTYGLGAIVGIQKTGGTGTVLNPPMSDWNLTLNSIAVSKPTIALYESVDITFNVTNNGPDTCEGDLWIYSPTFGLIKGDNFTIAAGETKDCVLSYTPTATVTDDEIYCAYPIGNGNYTLLDDKKHVTLTVNPSDASDNVDLTIGTPVVENAEYDKVVDGHKYYNLWGKEFNATVTVSNNTGNNYHGTFLWVLIPNGESALVNEVAVDIPAGTQKAIPITVSALDYSKSCYILKTSYVKNGGYSWKEDGIYWLRRAIMTYAPDGTMTVTKPSGDTSYDAAANAATSLVVDVTGTGITSITPNALDNTLYIYSGSKPSGLDGKNTVLCDGSSYTAEQLTLKDNSQFYSPVDIAADHVTFNYTFTTAADGSRGWNTLFLPYDVTSVTADGEPIDWFHNSTDTGKNFWVKAFTGDESSKVYFDYADEIKANTPYIVAFPGDTWGSKWDLSHKTIRFIGENVTINKSGSAMPTTGANYRFVGNTLQDNTENIYCINAEGDAFSLNASGGSAPFRAYFKPGAFSQTVSSLAIGSVTGETTAITLAPVVTNNEDGYWYTIDGRRLTGKPSQKGIYIQNGKKIIISSTTQMNMGK